jgi:predicted amidohydrolase
MRLALAQYAPDSDMNASLGMALDRMAAAAGKGAELILFPELCLSPFFPRLPAQEVSRYAVTSAAECIRQFQAACRRLRLAASPNVYLREGSRCFDASLLIDAEGGLQGISKMVHIAQLPGFYEQDYYAPADSGFDVYDTPWGKIGLVVCFDRHYPESIRTCALRGAVLILIATANTMAEPRDVFECELRAAAFQNGLYIAMCNRIGREGDSVFCGESLLVDPHGAVLAKAGDGEELLIAQIDPAQSRMARATRPYLSLRRRQLYE